jgi:hypothetical protein
LGRGNKARRREAKKAKKPVEIDQGKKRGVGYFRLDGIRTNSWWEGENWTMVSDPENPFRDLTREEELKITEILKRMW